MIFTFEVWFNSSLVWILRWMIWLFFRIEKMSRDTFIVMSLSAVCLVLPCENTCYEFGSKYFWRENMCQMSNKKDACLVSKFQKLWQCHQKSKIILCCVIRDASSGTEQQESRFTPHFHKNKITKFKRHHILSSHHIFFIDSYRNKKISIRHISFVITKFIV